MSHLTFLLLQNTSALEICDSFRMHTLDKGTVFPLFRKVSLLVAQPVFFFNWSMDVQFHITI